MSDEQDKQTSDDKPDKEPQGPLGGERLAQARREQQISVLEVAKELHLDEPKVRALERNEFDVLGAPVFAKGHLRKYAQLVDVDEGDIFADYYKMTHTADLPPVVVGKPKVRQELSPGPWIAAIVVLLVAAAAYLWFVVASETTTQEPPPAVTTDTGQSVEDSPPVEEPAEQPAIEESVVADTAIPDEPPVVAVEEPAPESPPAGQMHMSLTFSGDCWTEISDAKGQRLFFDMGRSGRSVDLTGSAPFTVLFGNVENVSVRIDGNDFPVSPSTPGSRTARLIIIKP